MADIQTLPEAPLNPQHMTIRRKDYRPPDWLVPEIRLDFDLDAECTRVRATLQVERYGEHARPLRLDGSEVKLVSVKLDGVDADHRFEGDQLVVDIAASRALLVQMRSEVAGSR